MARKLEIPGARGVRAGARECLLPHWLAAIGTLFGRRVVARRVRLVIGQPDFVHFRQQHPDEPQARSAVWEDADDPCAATDLQVRTPDRVA